MYMQTISGCGRVVRRKLADDSLSFTFSVVRNMRLNGRPTHIELAKIGTFRQRELSERAEEFWKIVDEKLAKLVKTNKLWNNDADKVRNQFSKVIARPGLTNVTNDK